jgi:hypothetical protein
MPEMLPHTIWCNYVPERRFFQVDWIVDARKMKGNDRQVVSPPFELPVFAASGQEAQVTFKLMICALSRGDWKGGTSFKKSSSKGVIHLKCEGDLDESVADVSFCFAVGSAAGLPTSLPRGPLTHNFARCAVGRLPDDQAEWDFTSAVDEDSLTLLVRVAAMPCAYDLSPAWDTARAAAS